MGAHRYIGDIQFQVDGDNDLDIHGLYFQPEHGPEIVAFINDWLGVTPPAYAAEDVAALVAEVERIEEQVSRGNYCPMNGSGNHDRLRRVLKPFQTDPDKELRKEVARLQDQRSLGYMSLEESIAAIVFAVREHDKGSAQ